MSDAAPTPFTHWPYEPRRPAGYMVKGDGGRLFGPFSSSEAAGQWAGLNKTLTASYHTLPFWSPHENG